MRGVLKVLKALKMLKALMGELDFEHLAPEWCKALPCTACLRVRRPYRRRPLSPRLPTGCFARTTSGSVPLPHPVRRSYRAGDGSHDATERRRGLHLNPERKRAGLRSVSPPV